MFNLLVCSVLWCIVKVYSQQTFPYVSFMGQTLANHSYVNLNLVGNLAGVQCHTDLSTCCSSAQGSHRGDWYFPDEVRLQFANDIYQFREAQRVDLRRSSGISPTGIYRCDIPTNVVHDDTDILVRDTVYVGLYTGDGGSVSIPRAIVLTVDSDLNGPSPQFTLTCISTGGPATTVTWTKDSTTVTEGNETVLNDPVTAQYTHTLTVTGRQEGLYNCTVKNNKPSSASAALNVESPPTPSIMNLRQKGEDSLLVTWIASEGTNVNGYIIYYKRDGGEDGLFTVNGGATNSTIVTGLIVGTYSITMVATSTSFSSSNTTAVTVEIVPLPDLPVLSVDSTTATSISLSRTSGSSNVVSYEVEWQRDTSLGCSDEDQGNTTIIDGSTSYTISGLEEDSRYEITVTATNAGGGTSAIVTEMTLGAAPSKAPSSVRVSTDNSSSIIVKWGPVDCIHQNGDITGYLVRYKVKESSGNTLTQSVSGGSVSQTTISGLNSSTTYSIRVAAVTAGSLIGPYSSPVDGVNRGASPPTEMTAVQSGSTSIRVTWTPPTPLGDTTGYSISFTGGGSSGSVNVNGGSVTSHTLNGLQNGEMYTIFVVSTFQNFPSDPISMEVTLIPAPGQAVVSVNSITATSISLSWSVASGRVASWEVVWRPTDRGTESTSGSLPGNTYTIHHLDSSTIYTVTVRATNVAGTTNSTPILFSTSSGTDVLQAESSHSDTDNTGAIIGGIVAVVLILLVMVIVMVIILLLFRRQGENCPAKTRGSVDAAATQNQTPEFSNTSEATYQNADQVTTTNNEAYSTVNRTGSSFEDEFYEVPQDLLLSTSPQPATAVAGDYEPVPV